MKPEESPFEAADRVWSENQDNPRADPGNAKGANGAASDAEPLPFKWAGSIEPDLRVRDFVRGLLSSAAIGVVYGESGTGKTFFILHVSMSTALGLSLYGRRVERGSVLYVCIEGALGITNRIAAFRKHYGIDGDIPLGLVTMGVDLRDADADVARIIATAKAIDRTYPPLRMIVIDTLSGALAGGSDRDPQDTGALLANALRIRDETGALVMFVHHSGKNPSAGSRGDSRLICDIDIELKVTRDNGATTSTVKSTKQRDFPAGDTFAFSLATVELGTNELGEPVTSCVVIEETTAPTASKSATPLTKNQQTMFTVLHAAGSDGLATEAWYAGARKAGLGVKRAADLYDFREALRRKGLVHGDDDRWFAAR